ncbi:methyltransferase domain-containing protein [Sorangium sp. So ce726]|uniref:SAM-dependent methyltransferase n=1 Tax=Sorangium sp. So ce726 TaxID=3133319 RepID=UPI003F5D6242
MTQTIDMPDFAAVGRHYDAKGTDDLNYLSSEDGLIVHHHTGWFEGGVVPPLDDEASILRELGRSETRLTELGARMLALRVGEHGLDCGCGRGASSLLFAKHHGVTMEGITVSATQEAFATSAARSLGLTATARFFVENVYDAKRPTAAYDFVWACESTEYMADRRALFAEWARVLNPSGRAVVFVLTCVASRRHEIDDAIRALDTHYVSRIGDLCEYTDGAAANGMRVDDVVGLERETLPYWRLRLRSKHRAGTEPLLIRAFESGALRFLAMRFVKPGS